VQTEQFKVLLVDDDQGDFEMIRVMLAQAEHGDYQVDWVSTYEEALDAFGEDKYDVILLDYFLEDRTGLDLLRETSQLAITAPIIMLTGRGSRQVDLDAMGLGAADYLIKGQIDPDTLERAIRHAIERSEGARAVQALKETDEQHRGILGRLSEQWGVEDPLVSAARFRAVFESTRSGIALLDLDGMLIGANPAFAEIFSSSLGWTEGLSYLDLLDEGDKAPVSKELEALASGERNKFEAARRFLKRDGEVIWAHATMILIKNGDGDPHHLVVMLERVGEEG